MISAGTVLRGKFKVIRLLKSGGMGFVYEGEYNGNKCVIKEPIRGEGLKDNYYLDKIKIEAEILSRVKHNNIVGYIDSFEINNSFFLIEEYVEGESLKDKYYKKPANEDEAIFYILLLLDAVQYLHNNQIKHRDIKPDNLIISSKIKKLTLIDFGTSKYFRRGRRETKSVPKSTIVGSPYYAPAEQWEGETSEISDIFSIGRTMYFMLTGEHPPDSPYKRLDFKGKKISKVLEEIVIKAAEPEIRDRYSSVSEIIKYLNVIKNHQEPKVITRPGVRLIVGANSNPLDVFTTIGSDDHKVADILIPDPDPKGPYIEKIHAVIKKENEKYWIYDNSSKFGTFVEESGKKTLISPRKDVIEFLRGRGYISPQSISEKRLLKDGDFILLAWDPILGDYIRMQFKES
jgi:serine/threonine protein kinase